MPYPLIAPDFHLCGVSMNQLIREREQMEIAEKNISLARKLESVKPYYSAGDQVGRH